MLLEKQITEIKTALEKCENPFFLYHDDPDGLASFVMLYHKYPKGRGMAVKSMPRITEFFGEQVLRHNADAVFVLDVAIVEQVFIDMVKVPVYWIDHHTPLERKNVSYYNPRLVGKRENIPTPALIRQITEADLWLASIGCIGDWYWPPFIEEFRKKYPKLLTPESKSVETSFYSPAGTLVKVFSFILKGNTSEVNKCVKILTRIESPDEILNQTTSRGKYLWKRYKFILEHYDELLKRALKQKPHNGVVVFTYEQDSLSLTKDLANELIIKFPNTVIVLGRKKSGEYRCSLRGSHVDLYKIVQNALDGVQGRAGGHEHACGASIKEADFEKFIMQLEAQAS